MLRLKFVDPTTTMSNLKQNHKNENQLLEQINILCDKILEKGDPIDICVVYAHIKEFWAKINENINTISR